MTGKRLLDAVAIFTAARKVASKHAALRIHQLDIYNKTSTLARTLQSQSDRVTLTLKAATALAGRFNGPRYEYSTQPSQTETSKDKASKQTGKGSTESSKGVNPKEGLTQDHFYEKSKKNTTAEPPPEGNLEVRQEKGKSVPLPDGSVPSIEDQSTTSSVSEEESSTKRISADRAKISQRQAENHIPSQVAESPSSSAQKPDMQANIDNERSKTNVSLEQETFYTPTSSSDQALSSLPRAKIPRNTEDTQESEEPVSTGQINQDVFYSPRPKSEPQTAPKTVPEAQAISEQEQLSEQAYSEIFHSPKVASMMRGQPRNPDSPSQGLELTGARATPVKETKAPVEKDQVSSSARTPLPVEMVGEQRRDHSVDSTASVHESVEDVHALATDVSEVARSSQEPSEVCQ